MTSSCSFFDILKSHLLLQPPHPQSANVSSHSDTFSAFGAGWAVGSLSSAMSCPRAFLVGKH